MIKNLSHLSLSTESLEKVKNLNINILDFKIAHNFINNKNEIYGFFIYCGNNTFIEFFKVEKLMINKQNLYRHLCFEVENIEIMKNKLEILDQKIEIKRGRTDNILQFFVKDFENNMIEFHQNDKHSKLNKFLDLK